MPKTLLLFDANSLIHRAYHALPPLTNLSGEPIQAVYGVSTILMRLWKEDKPDYAAALFDRPEPTFRDAKYKEYKATRAETATELVSQLGLIPELFSFFGVASFSERGFEADDLIATFAEKFKKEKDLRVIILTGDMDTLQLIEDDKIVVRIFKKGVSETMTFDEKAVEEKYGLHPKQLIDYKSMVGDNSDNIKGVPGIGPKTASALLREYGNMKTALKKLPADSKIREKIMENKEQMELSRDLVELVRDIPVKASLSELEVKPDFEALKNYFEKQGFKFLLKRLESNGKEALVPKAPKPKQGQIL